MNYWPECIDFWHGASLGLGDTDCSYEVPGVKKQSLPKETYLYTGLHSRKL